MLLFFLVMCQCVVRVCQKVIKRCWCVVSEKSPKEYLVIFVRLYKKTLKEVSEVLESH